MSKTPMTEERKNELRKNVISGHRKRMKLCLRCGLDPHKGDCSEIYDKADMRQKVSTNNIDIEKRITSIKAIRSKKGLCINCGKECHNSDCNSNFTESDMRTEEEKKLRPAKISAPKSKKTSLLETLSNNKEESKNLPKMTKTEDIQLFKEYIVLNLESSSEGHIIEYSYIRHLSKKNIAIIICCIGDPDKLFTVSDLLKLKKLTNVSFVKNNSDQNIYNYIYSSKRYISYYSKFVEYAKQLKIPVTIFPSNTNITSTNQSATFNIGPKGVNYVRRQDQPDRSNEHMAR